MILLFYRLDKYNTLPEGTRTNNIFNGPSLHSLLTKWKSSYESEFRNITNNIVRTKRNMAQVIILCFGTWDAAYRNIKYFAEQTTKILRKFFASISADPFFSHVKFFVLTTPAWKERAEEFINNNFPYPLTRKNLRNNVLLAAEVSLTIEMLKDFPNVFVLDYYSISISRSNEMTDNYH